MIQKDIQAQIQPGVRVRVYEGTTPFEGLVIARKHGKEEGATFTVRAIVASVGVEKVYPFGSSVVTKVEIIQKPKKVRRSKLYWIRNVPGKKIRKRLGTSL